jgi:hypothetical protein
VAMPAIPLGLHKEAVCKTVGRLRLTRSHYGHDCKLSGCKPHVCKPMTKSTIHNIHSILSGAFEAEVDRRAAAFLAQLTSRSTAQSG